MKKVLAFYLLVMTCSAHAATYSKEQLNSMDRAGSPPASYQEKELHSESASFRSCKSAIKGVYSQVIGEYPVKITEDTGSSFGVKVWTNDGYVSTFCKNGQKIVSVAEYK